jgi:hypothetical protein
MATQHGLRINEIYPAPGFQPKQSENGGVTASHSYTLLAQSWNNSTVRNKFARGNSIATIDPNIGAQWSYLTVASKTLDFQEGGYLVVSVEFSGSATAQYGDGDGISDDAPPVYRLEGRLSEKPLSEHPKWQDLDSSQKFALGELIEGNVKAKYDWTQVGNYELVEGFSWGISFVPLEDAEGPITLTGDAIEFAKLIAAGEITFLSPTITWTETTQGSDGVTSAQLNKLGKISSPRGGPPTPSGSRDWMLTGAGQEQRGDLKQTSLEWTLSEREGFNSFLYD